MTERGTDLHPLKIRYHGTVDIPYDERYTEFIQPTGLMPFISLVSRGGPNMNPSALTALVDRWRPETHTFHLRAGEMAPTLQDVSMILGLPIQGDPLCMNIASDGWRGQMEDLIGRAPPAPANPKERVPAGASFSWIRTNFAECPEGANEDTRRTYARVYLWYMISRTLFPDSGGKLAHWCWLKALTVLDSRWSWGTAALAYLYRQLDEACRRTGSRTGSGGIGGCLLLLSVWSWDRISVGRPRVLQESHWPHYRNNPDLEPTWAYLWDNTEWEPYGTYYRIGAGMPDLNHKRTEEARFWRERREKVAANDKAKRDTKKNRVERARNREVNQKSMEEEDAHMYAEEEVCEETREAERNRLRERADAAHATEEHDDRIGKWPRWTHGK
nr:uncharacterized protein LOC127348070 [Lolium perenne]